MKEKGKNGKAAYMSKLVESVFAYHSCDMTAKVDGQEKFRGYTLSASVGIGRYNGSGMQQLPESVADDGLLDITVIEHMSIPRIAMAVPLLFNGKIYTHKRVRHYTGRTVELQFDSVREMEIDGEALGTTPLTITIEDKRLKIIVP